MTPLEGRRIAVTRPAPDGASLAGRLAALGAVPLITPAIEVVPGDPALLDAALTRMRRFDWIVFTSRHAVEAVTRRGHPLEGPRIAAVGPATAEALADHGIAVTLVPPDHSAAGLLAALGNVAGLRVLFPASAIAHRTLPDGLRARGAHVLEVVAYDTRSTGVAYDALSGADAVTFTSPSTVRGLLGSNRVPPSAKVVCIGPGTAEAARDAGLTVASVAVSHSEDGLVEALIRIFSDGKTHGMAT